MKEESQVKTMWERIKQEILSGLKHGFFEYSIFGESKNGNRHVIFKAGKNHKFTISPEEIRDE